MLIIGGAANVGVLRQGDRFCLGMIKGRLVETFLKNGEDASSCGQAESQGPLAGGFQPLGRKAFSESEEAETRAIGLRFHTARLEDGVNQITCRGADPGGPVKKPGGRPFLQIDLVRWRQMFRESCKCALPV